MRYDDYFRPFSFWIADLEQEVARHTRALPRFCGVTAQGWPYCPGVGRLAAFLRVPGGLVWWGERKGRAYWMWQPLKPGE